jgi:mRNA interferase MazF
VKRGDIVLVDFDPTLGHEQAGARPALVLSPEAFNRMTGLAMVVPVTRRVRNFPFEVSLSGTRTVGVALCHQSRTIDTRARRCKVVEQAPESVVAEAVAKVRAILA